MAITIDQVPMWCVLHGIGHAVGSTRSGWAWCVCGLWTPNGNLTKEKPQRICSKCREQIKNAVLDMAG